MRRRWALALATVVLGAAGAAAAIASEGSVTGFPGQIRTVDLSGYRIVTSYSLGTNTGNTFEQFYLPGGMVTATGRIGPLKGQTFSSKYVAMPVGHHVLMVTWYTTAGVLTDVFVMNFERGIVSDVAPGASPPSLGTARIDRAGAAEIP
jgi:hypothetical protein